MNENELEEWGRLENWLERQGEAFLIDNMKIIE